MQAMATNDNKAGLLPLGGGAASDKWPKQLSIPPIGREHAADHERLKQKLKLEQQARDDGAHGLPHKDDRDLNAMQRRICEEIFRGIAAVHRFLAEQLARAAQLLAGLRPAALDEELERTRIDQVVARSLTEHRAELIDLKERELDALLDLRYFRANNKLQRAAVYRASPHGLASLLALLMLVESGFNGLLLRKISDEGWIGGIFIALLISAVNLALGIAAGGFGWRLMGHVRLQTRLLGGAVGVACLAVAVVWNIYVAHFREVAELAASQYAAGALPQAALDAWRHVRTEGLFGLHTMYSWALLVLGLGAHLLVSKEAWDHLGDRYFDYMKVDRRYQHARDAFTDAMAEVEDNARGAMEETLADLDKAVAESEQTAVQARYVSDQARQRHAEALAAEAEWVRQGASLLQAYREENLKVRHEGTEPAYFRTFPSLADYRDGRFGESAEKAELRGALQSVETRLAGFADDLKATDDAVAENHRIAKRLRLHGESLLSVLGDGVREIEAQVLQVADRQVSQRRELAAAAVPTSRVA
jgi:hypothetical protein